jgi:ketosteroid isomerase-like protein
MRSYLFVAFLLCAFPAYAAEDPDHEIHQELRGILTTLQSSINDGKYDEMLPILSRDIRATPINQEVMSSHEEVSAYFKRWFGSGGYLKKLDMKLDADALTELSADKSWGLVRGSGLERYTLADERKYDMKTRWTATVVKESDGKWRLRSIHIGTNFLDNPILKEAESAIVKVAIAVALGGLILGAVLGFVFGRRKK